jgi:hypothetical protein
MMIIVGGMPVYCSLLPLLLLFNTIDCRGEDHVLYRTVRIQLFILFIVLWTFKSVSRSRVSKYVTRNFADENDKIFGVSEDPTRSARLDNH